jgi:hypothetical protein
VVALVAAPSKVATDPIATTDDINFFPGILTNVCGIEIASEAIE